MQPQPPVRGDGGDHLAGLHSEREYQHIGWPTTTDVPATGTIWWFSSHRRAGTNATCWIDIRERIEAQRRTVPVELLRRVATGDTNRQVARDLGVSEGTVSKHLENIYARLEVHSRTEALARVGDLLAP